MRSAQASGAIRHEVRIVGKAAIRAKPPSLERTAKTSGLAGAALADHEGHLQVTGDELQSNMCLRNLPQPYGGDCSLNAVLLECCTKKHNQVRPRVLKKNSKLSRTTMLDRRSNEKWAKRRYTKYPTSQLQLDCSLAYSFKSLGRGTRKTRR